jgi:HPt (histidine-containing phosphotransfer) domain-containing protein
VVFSAKEFQMSIHQSSNHKNAVGASHRPAQSISLIASDAVDLDTLNAFEDLQSDDGPDLIVELIDLYVGELPRLVTEICKAVIETDWASLKRAAHALKGSSASLGVRHVAETCAKLERMDSNDSPGTVATLVRLLEYESAMVNASLAAIRQRRLR